MKARDVVRSRGHPLVQGLHKTTFEVTRECELTLSGDCIIGVCADKGAADLSAPFKRLLSDDQAVLLTRLCAGSESVEVRSRGSSQFTLDHPTDLVWRRSGFVCGRTVGIYSDCVARTLPRSFIDRLRQGDDLIVELIVEVPATPDESC
ncbi:hypothetical protein ABH15_03840 [Methanoculleus taiwanensis]|uniref:DUF371 domain-containing protein n=1 Tax=Methanoculleus taiwanensis TaxID=1550565 RepID=A0A498H6K2_9EURY|nr:DUF371 domain-containing protein [Methanoculleus taiwanensis]RXE57244.1 hypothetical protein ABH15_03840 [Methanoculleus taiwanensis]